MVWLYISLTKSQEHTFQSPANPYSLSYRYEHRAYCIFSKRLWKFSSSEVERKKEGNQGIPPNPSITKNWVYKGYIFQQHRRFLNQYDNIIIFGVMNGQQRRHILLRVQLRTNVCAINRIRVGGETLSKSIFCFPI